MSTTRILTFPVADVVLKAANLIFLFMLMSVLLILMAGVFLITYMHHSSEFHSPRHLLWLVERSKKGALLAIGINELDQQKKN
mmetsp:Transcript_31708/g.46444  ORF Transcript_31708/g.46444 Transcript_31708/m.46444 type:complete len:83 (-) Transcript_31708:33-281(-)